MPCQAHVSAVPEGRIAVQGDTAKCANTCALVDAAGFLGVAAVRGAMFRSVGLDAARIVRPRIVKSSIHSR